MLVALALMLQARAATPPPNSAANANLLARARREETAFFYEWRKEWEQHGVLLQSDRRLFSLHCHAGERLEAIDVGHLIATPFSRKSMCPIWFQPDGVTPDDESLAIDNGLQPEARARIRAKRATVLSLLDSAAAVMPDDPWLIGQRVRLLVDQRERDRALAIANDHCNLADSYCSLLVGYVLASGGNWRDANSAFAYGVTQMPLNARCAFLDIKAFLDEDEWRMYDPLPCKEQDAINARFWWMADPLLMQPGNERLSVHLYRETLVLLHSALTADERFDWRTKYGGQAAGTMILRYGWPETGYWNKLEDDKHFLWLGFRDSSVNASREYFRPRFHTTPTYHATIDLSTLNGSEPMYVAAKWNQYREAWDQDWWPVEHFARAGPLGAFDYQATVFRRGSGPLVVVAADPRSSLLPDSVLRRYTAGLVAMSGPTDSARRTVGSAALRPKGAMVLSIATIPGPQLISAEVLVPDNDSAPSARARFAITGPPGLSALTPREVALSDPMFFAPPGPNDSLPRSAVDAIDRMLPSAELHRGSKVGVFFEVYGLTTGEDADLMLKVLQQDQAGLLRRVAARLGIADLPDGSIQMRWRDAQPGVASGALMIAEVPVQSRALVLDFAQLKPGRYALEIGVGRPGEQPVVSRRSFTIKDR